MNDLRNLSEKLRNYLTRYASVVTRYRFVVMFMIVGAAVSFALLKTRSFIDIPRNEERYNEEVLMIQYKSIDESILEEFKDAQQDDTIEVNPSFDPDRSNPFSE